jgi:hypothetical protein
MPDYSDDPERAAEEHEGCARKFATLKRELANAMVVVQAAQNVARVSGIMSGHLLVRALAKAVDEYEKEKDVSIH